MEFLQNGAFPPASRQPPWSLCLKNLQCLFQMWNSPSHQYNISANLDQFAYRANRSTQNAISTALHSALTHLENNNTCVRMLLADFSPVFSTMFDIGFIHKQTVWIGGQISSTIVLNTETPQGCVLSLLLF